MTVEHWTVYACLCDGTADDGELCNAMTDHSDDMKVIRILAEEDGWVLDGERAYCPKHKDQLPE